MCVDVHPRIRKSLGAPRVPLFNTEGIRKADSAISQELYCIALLGVWNFRGSNQYGGKTILPDWEYIALNDRKVYIVFDSDVMENLRSTKLSCAFLNFYAAEVLKSSLSISHLQQVAIRLASTTFLPSASKKCRAKQE